MTDRTASARRDFVLQWSVFGATSMVEKVGSKHWAIVYCDGLEFPGVYKTKREAMDAVSRFACAVEIQ